MVKSRKSLMQPRSAQRPEFTPDVSPRLSNAGIDDR